MRNAQKPLWRYAISKARANTLNARRPSCAKTRPATWRAQCAVPCWRRKPLCCAALLQGLREDAQRQAQTALAYLKGQENGFLPETFAAWKVLALTELSQTRYEKAWRRIRSAGTHLPELATADPALAAKWMALEGIAQRSAGHWENARAAFARALERLQACLPGQHGDLGVIHLECAHLYWERNDFEAAAERLQQANDTFQGLQRSQFPWARIAVLASQATVYRMQGDLRQAREKISQGRSACTGLKDLQAIQERRFALEDICLKLGIGNDRGALQQFKTKPPPPKRQCWPSEETICVFCLKGWPFCPRPTKNPVAWPRARAFAQASDRLVYGCMICL